MQEKYFRTMLMNGRKSLLWKERRNREGQNLPRVETPKRRGKGALEHTRKQIEFQIRNIKLDCKT